MQTVPQLEVITTDIHTPVRCFISEDFGSYVPAHYHSALELIYVLSGSMSFVVNGLSAEQLNLGNSSQEAKLQPEQPRPEENLAKVTDSGNRAEISNSSSGTPAKVNAFAKDGNALPSSSSANPNLSSINLPNHASDFRIAKLPQSSMSLDNSGASAGAESCRIAHERYATPSLFNVGKVSASAFSAGQETQYLTTTHQTNDSLVPKQTMRVGNEYRELSASGEFNCILFNSKELHMTCCPVYNRSLVVQIPDEFLLSSLGLSESDEVTFALALASPQCLQQMQEALVKLTNLIDLSPQSQTPIIGKEIRFKQALYTLLECLLEVKVTTRNSLSLSAADNQLRQRVYPILDMVNRHYAEEISLAQVAEKMHLHPNYFCRIFKQVVGQSFHAYLSEVRLCHIYQDLLTSSEPVATIVERNGVVCNNFFYRQFKRRFNITPSALRQNHGHMYERA